MSHVDEAGDLVLDSWDAGHIAELLNGNADHFSAQLLRLIAKADIPNTERLRRGFPRIVEAYERWYASPMPEGEGGAPQ